jgi:uncharacterized membrane protein YvbJ
MKYCRKCKKEHSENNEFCPKCGSKLVKLVEEKESQKEHKIPKQISFKKLLLIIVPIAFIVVIIVGVASFYSIGSNPSSFTSTGANVPERIRSMVNEYNNYISQSNTDIKQMSSLYNAWVVDFNNAIKDNKLTSSEVSLMTNDIESYASEYNIVSQHLTNFKSFVETNEQDLKTLSKYGYPDMDTFKLKSNMDDARIGMQNNVNYMKTKTEDLINTYQAQQQELANILKILIGLA